jgi:hypothetical protein
VEDLYFFNGRGLFILQVSVSRALDGRRVVKKLDEHFEDGAWVDFVRGVASEDQAHRMHQHLNSGCEQCSRRMSTWKGVLNFTRQESAHEPPEHAVRAVKAAFDIEGRLPFFARFAAAAKLLLDNIREPLPEGVRGPVAPARQLLHESGNFLIDLRLEAAPGDLILLTGQIVNPEAGNEATAGARVYLVSSRDRLVAQTVANPFGEFHLSYRTEADLSLYVEVPGSLPIAVPVPTSADPRSPS